MTDIPDDKFTPSTILDPYRDEIARLRGLLAKHRNLVIDEVLMVLMRARTQMKVTGQIITISGLIEAVEGLKQ